MERQEKIEKIYESMADKTLSDGCIIHHSQFDNNKIISIKPNRLKNNFQWEWTLSYVSNEEHIASLYYDTINDLEKEWWSIIWHPVRIGDMLDYIYWSEHTQDRTIYSMINGWENKRLPIDEQSDECIDFVYSLIQK